MHFNHQTIANNYVFDSANIRIASTMLEPHQRPFTKPKKPGIELSNVNKSCELADCNRACELAEGKKSCELADGK